MDDFCIFSNSKEELKALNKVVTDFLRGELKLSIKPKATMLNSSLHGLSFLGTRIFPNQIRIKRENFKRAYRKLRLREVEYSRGLISYEEYYASQQSLLAYLLYWQAYPLKTRLCRGKGMVSFGSTNRVKRGGSWNNNANNLQVGNRNNNNPSNENSNNGFRLASTGAF